LDCFGFIGSGFVSGNNFKFVIFAGLLLIIAGCIWLAVSLQDVLIANVFWLGAFAIFVLLVWKHDFYLLQLIDYQRAVVYRYGKVNRVGGPGWVFIWPGIESYNLVDLRVKTIDVPKQEVVTKDGVAVIIDAIVYLKVKKDNQSVVNSVIEVEDYSKAAQLYVISSLRDVVGSIPLSDVISNIEIINAKIKENLERISKDWGIIVDSVEISDVKLPDEILDAMHQEKAAVQQKLARMEKALAQKAEIEAVKEAASGLDDKALAYYYIKAIENMSQGKGSKVFFPAEFSRLAESFSGSGLLRGKDGGAGAKKAVYYKDLLKKYVDTSVKKARAASAPNKKKKKGS
jgi:regulator of protease activity HflC (stomatin/prohibitin superfamily)